MAAPATADEVQRLREENAALRAQIAWLKQRLFGPGRSETLDRAQLLLQLGELEKLAGRTAAERPAETITYQRAAGPAPKRTLPAESFAHLPVKETVEIIPEAVRADPSAYERIVEERTFQVDLVPPQLFKREIVRPKFGHCLERSRAPLLAPAPQRIGTGGFASAGLIAWALTAKYCDHLPLYRQEKMLARWGAPISRQSLSDWVGAATALLEPPVKQMKQDLLASGYVQVDETRSSATILTSETERPRKAGCGRSRDLGAMSSSSGAFPAGTRKRSGCWGQTISGCCSRTATKPTRLTCRRTRAPSGSAAWRTRVGASSKPRLSGPRPPNACCG